MVDFLPRVARENCHPLVPDRKTKVRQLLGREADTDALRRRTDKGFGECLAACGRLLVLDPHTRLTSAAHLIAGVAINGPIWSATAARREPARPKKSIDRMLARPAAA